MGAVDIDRPAQRPPERATFQRTVEAGLRSMEISPTPLQDLTLVDPELIALDHHPEEI
jgi:hypothetical protein